MLVNEKDIKTIVLIIMPYSLEIIGIMTLETMMIVKNIKEIYKNLKIWRKSKLV